MLQLQGTAELCLLFLYTDYAVEPRGIFLCPHAYLKAWNILANPNLFWYLKVSFPLI